MYTGDWFREFPKLDAEKPTKVPMKPTDEIERNGGESGLALPPGSHSLSTS